MHSPLETSELLDRILSFVDTAKDLCASALVHSSWAHPAQATLFSEIGGLFGEVQRLLSLLLPILEVSPRFARLVIKLDLVQLSKEHLERLGNIAFPRLTTLCIDNISVYAEAGVVSVQKLLQNPSLLSVSVHGAFVLEEHFLRIWDGCSETIKHLSYSSGNREFAFLPIEPQTPPRRIKLESFNAPHRNPEQTRLWLQHPSCPFDVSSLKALQTGETTGDLFGTVLAPALETIEVFSTANWWYTNRELPHLHRTSQLTISMPLSMEAAFELLRTIRPENRQYLKAVRFVLGSPTLRILRKDDVQALVDNLSTIRNDFPNLKIVSLALPFEGERVKVAVEELLGPRAPTIRWDFSPDWWKRPWHARIE
ncbi:hypothetical protein FB45DRAFT_1051146 [Roridomyces roridus]|uniref:Uncharacterized protein n=1 Tax=Roridomyces roridus TaxID=1738132 RepID=A0AAD7CL85_9AGAR|nr:hypothetical protein FB45DRAFT_1051146 [Roridomyces roridus]